MRTLARLDCRISAAWSHLRRVALRLLRQGTQAVRDPASVSGALPKGPRLLAGRFPDSFTLVVPLRRGGLHEACECCRNLHLIGEEVLTKAH